MKYCACGQGDWLTIYTVVCPAVNLLATQDELFALGSIEFEVGTEEGERKGRKERRRKEETDGYCF